MRQRIIDLRIDEDTAAYIADALKLQLQYGYDHACDYLKSVGVNSQLAQRLLAIRYDRRGSLAASNVVAYGRGEAHAAA